MNVRYHCLTLIGTLVAVSLAATGGVSAAEAGQPKADKKVVMVPILAESRVTSPDRAFIERATDSAIKTMTASQAEINSSRLGNVQGEAVRAFNTAAYAYNNLADIASERRINVATPSSIFAQDRTPNPIDGQPVAPADVEYLSARQQSLGRAIAIYSQEVKAGRDPIVVEFAKQMKSRLEHDLFLATLGIKALDSGGYGDRPSDSGASSITQ